MAVGVFLVGAFGHLEDDVDFDFFVFGGCRCCSGFDIGSLLCVVSWRVGVVV